LRILAVLLLLAIVVAIIWMRAKRRK